MCFKLAFILLFGIVYVHSVALKRDANDDLSEALSDLGLSNLYDVMKKHSVTVQNILHVGEEQLKEWNVPFNDILDYKRVKKEQEQHGGASGDEDSEKYSKLAAFLISLLVGGLGADWFYLSAGSAGYIVAGVFKLLTCGGLGIWWLVDWIRVLADTFPDGNGLALKNDM